MEKNGTDITAVKVYKFTNLAKDRFKFTSLELFYFPPESTDKATNGQDQVAHPDG